MKKLLFSRYLIFLISFTCINSAIAKSTGSFNTNITFNGASRQLAVYVPANYDSSLEYRLMICLHGLGDNITNYRNALVSYGWPGDMPNTIFICPEASTTTSDFYTPSGDEAIIQASIDYAKANYNIDLTDIILQGFSIGGRAALRYGLDHYSQFKGLLLNTPAVQGVKEGLNLHPKSFSFTYANASQIPIYITHGKTDLLYEGPVDTAFKELVLNNGMVRYKEFPGLGHAIPAFSGMNDFITFFNQPENPGHDITIQGLTIDSRTCSNFMNASVLVQNTGHNLIDTVTIQYFIIGSTKTYTWTTSLHPFQHDVLNLPLSGVPPGNYTLDVRVKYLNTTLTDSDTVGDHKLAPFQVVDKGAALPLTEGFNGPTDLPVNWLLNPTGDAYSDWAIDNTVHETGAASLGAFNTIFVFDNLGRRAEIQSPVLDLSSTSNPGLKFDVAYNYFHYTAAVLGVDTVLADSLEVLISTDCGGSWQSLFKKGGTQLATFHNPILNPTSIAAGIIAPKDTNWRTEEINLGSYATAKEAVIKFSYISDLGGSIYIDNLALSTYLSINQVNNPVAFRVYPNPANGNVNIITGNEKILKVNITDLSGREMLNVPLESGVSSSLSVNATALPRGLYLFRVFTSNGVKTEKVILQ